MPLRGFYYSNLLRGLLGLLALFPLPPPPCRRRPAASFSLSVFSARRRRRRRRRRRNNRAAPLGGDSEQPPPGVLLISLPCRALSPEERARDHGLAFKCVRRVRALHTCRLASSPHWNIYGHAAAPGNRVYLPSRFIAGGDMTFVHGSAQLVYNVCFGRKRQQHAPRAPLDSLY